MTVKKMEENKWLRRFSFSLFGCLKIPKFDEQKTVSKQLRIISYKFSISYIYYLIKTPKKGISYKYYLIKTSKKEEDHDIIFPSFSVFSILFVQTKHEGLFS